MIPCLPGITLTQYHTINIKKGQYLSPGHQIITSKNIGGHSLNQGFQFLESCDIRGLKFPEDCLKSIGHKRLSYDSKATFVAES